MGFGEGQGFGMGMARGKTERVAVPAMPMPLAILCCVLNFLVPGLGTILAGLSVCCCSRNEDMSAGSQIGSCCISFGIGLLQLLLTVLLLIGWIWSCVWGVFFLGMSAEYYHDNPVGGGTVLRPGGTQTTVVVQPGSAGYQYGYPASQPAQTYAGYSQQPQQGYPSPQQPQGYPPAQQGYPPPQQQGYQPPPQGYAQPYNPQQSTPGFGEAPPPYTETETMPTAPPEHKVNL
ncbi:protein SPEC3-like [Ruditapes philippinarum]|uniref:protein SPEC3-like n=1 Tax=Ruditapes philippinarum TaxID=129788 RepID=UPI00295B266A|nr:protein SPEC3-like [Ruditapes philippinarum]XP_060585104.1 protein SPEC3-like [Ruditapes philippinarum]